MLVTDITMAIFSEWQYLTKNLFPILLFTPDT